MFGSRNSDWIQHAMNVLVGLFRRYGLVANVVKSCKMICQPGALWAGMSKEAMALKCTGVGESYQVRFQRHIQCLECGVELTAGYMMEHHHRMHGTEPAIDWSRLPASQTVQQPQVYDVRLPWTTQRCPCPFPGCLVYSHTWNGLYYHFNRKQWGDRISILEDHPNPIPRCE